MKPAKHNYTILKQICELIPAHLVPKLARSFGIDKIARSFSPWSHVVAMLHVQIAHSLSLNDVADTLRNHSGALTTMRGATPPSRNGLSHANRVRDPNMAQALFWDVLSHIESKHPNFGRKPKESQNCLHMVWEACANMEKYVQMGFSPKQRDTIFGAKEWSSFDVNDFEMLREKISQSTDGLTDGDSEQTLDEIIGQARGDFNCNNR